MSERNALPSCIIPQGSAGQSDRQSVGLSTGRAQTTTGQEGRPPVTTAAQAAGRVTFRAAVEAAMEQVEFRAARWRDPRLAYDMCRIMAEVYMMRPDGQARIGEELLEVYLVQEVFRELRREHLETVIRAYIQVEKTICAKKAYIRTALYNAVFEEAAANIEEVKQDRRTSIL